MRLLYFSVNNNSYKINYYNAVNFFHISVSKDLYYTLLSVSALVFMFLFFYFAFLTIIKLGGK